jgi:hypothetical protein
VPTCFQSSGPKCCSWSDFVKCAVPSGLCLIWLVTSSSPGFAQMADTSIEFGVDLQMSLALTYRLLLNLNSLQKSLHQVLGSHSR